jgi:uridine phosphorylase
MSHDPTRQTVTCEIDGKTYRGNYWIAGKILVVSTGMGGKSKQVGSTPAEILAEQLLRELAKEGKA